jgi:hypothetical protein
LPEAQKSNNLPFKDYKQMYMFSNGTMLTGTMATDKDTYRFALYQTATESSKEVQGRPVRLCKAYTSPWTL